MGQGHGGDEGGGGYRRMQDTGGLGGGYGSGSVDGGRY